MLDISRILFMVVKDYGLDVAQIFIIIFLFWKLFNNHLKHLALDVKENIEETKKIGADVVKLKERVSKVEGHLEVNR